MEAPRLVREISNERIIDELKCEAAICKAGTVFDGRIANAMHTKAEINAAEAQAASTDFMKDIAQVSGIPFVFSKICVEPLPFPVHLWHHHLPHTFTSSPFYGYFIIAQAPSRFGNG
jgi:hypothetical protein